MHYNKSSILSSLIAGQVGFVPSIVNYQTIFRLALRYPLSEQERPLTPAY